MGASIVLQHLSIQELFEELKILVAGTGYWRRPVMKEVTKLQQVQQEAVEELHVESAQLSAEVLLKKAKKMQATTTAAREHFAPQTPILGSILATGSARPANPVLEAAPRSLAEASISAIANSPQEQEEQINL